MLPVLNNNFFYIIIYEYFFNQKSVDSHIFCKMHTLLVLERKGSERRGMAKCRTLLYPKTKEISSTVEFVTKSGLGKYPLST